MRRHTRSTDTQPALYFFPLRPSWLPFLSYSQQFTTSLKSRAQTRIGGNTRVALLSFNAYVEYCLAGHTSISQSLASPPPMRHLKGITLADCRPYSQSQSGGLAAISTIDSDYHLRSSGLSGFSLERTFSPVALTSVLLFVLHCTSGIGVRPEVWRGVDLPSFPPSLPPSCLHFFPPLRWRLPSEADTAAGKRTSQRRESQLASAACVLVVVRPSVRPRAIDGRPYKRKHGDAKQVRLPLARGDIESE